MLPRVGYFLSVAAFARFKAGRARARGDQLTWLRDESSRIPSATQAARPAAAVPAVAVSAAAPAAAVPADAVPRQLEGRDHVPHTR
jgi:hypothetical protein